MAFASVVDDSGATMSFIDSKGRFLTQLKSAQSDNHSTRLAMTNVSTDYPSQLRGLATSTDEIVLVPTETTTVRFISAENIMDENMVKVNERVSSFLGIKSISKKKTISVSIQVE